jgi:beta-glucanase (GH16 family)
MIHSKLNFNFKYGKYEIKCKIPKGQGFWPAFWLFGSEREIDIFEFFSKFDEFTISSHIWCNGTSNPKYKNFSLGDLSLDFHTYTLEWTPHNLHFFVDGTKIWSINRFINTAGQQLSVDCGDYLPSGVYFRSKYVPQDNMSLIANLAIYAQSDSRHPNSSTPFPSNFEIDYIKVWQREISTGLTDLCANPKIIGNDVICSTQNQSYNFSGIQTNVTWSVSPNLTILTQNNNTLTIKPINNTINEVDGWIKASMNPDATCPNSLPSITKNIRIGKPNAPEVNIQKEPCDPDGYISFSATSSPGTNFEWNINGQLINSNVADYSVGSPNYNVSYSLTVSNSCGSKTISGSVISRNCRDNGPMMRNIQYLVYPNPTNSSINLSLPDDIKTKDINRIYVIDSRGNIRNTIEPKHQEIQLETFNYPVGLSKLIIEFKNKNPETLNFIIQR